MKVKLLSIVLVLFLAVSFTGTKQAYSDTRNVLLEFCTGTWCQWCPCGDYTAEQLLATHPGMIVLAYHGPLNYGGDPFTNFSGSGIIGQLGFTAYPTAIIDRTNSSTNFSYTMWTNAVNTEYTNNPTTPVRLVITSKDYNASTKVLTASIDATALQTISDQYKICYVITENGVVFTQTNNNNCTTGGANYVHKWITRNMVNGSLGENLNTGTWNQDQVITKTLNTTLDNAWIDANCQLTIFAYKDASPLYMANIGQSILQSVTEPLGIQGTGVVPKAYSLSQNYPNPFNPTTNIKFSVPKDGNVSLKIYDAIGNVVDTYVDGFMNAGSYNAEVDASSLASGIYFYTLKAGDFVQTKKMVLIK